MKRSSRSKEEFSVTGTVRTTSPGWPDEKTLPPIRESTAPYETGCVSVIMPAFNAASFIEESIKSVQNQTYTRWELLVADDASTDETATIVKRLASEDPRIRYLVVPQPNGCAARARNTAMANATGEFIAFLDADDLWKPEKLSVQYEYLRDNPDADALVSWYDIFGDPNTVNQDSRIMATARICTSDEVIKGKIPHISSTLVMRRYCYDEIGGQDEDPGLHAVEDSEHFARLLKHFSIHRVPRVLSSYRVSAPGESYSARHEAHRRERFWYLFEVLKRKELLTERELLRRRAFLFYDEARTNLFTSNSPYLRPLLRSVQSGHAPFKAWLLLCLSIFPRPLLKTLLTNGQRFLRRIVTPGYKYR